MAGPEDDFLSRWSRRKRAARAGAPEPARAPAPAPAATAPAEGPEASPPVVEPLPPVESLTTESDFSAFMGDEVDPGIRRDALKKLFEDPRFNVMDGMDVYVDDYSVPDPLPAGWLEKLNQVASLGDVPARERAEREAKERAEAGRRAGEEAAAQEGLASASGEGEPAPTGPVKPSADDAGQIETGTLPPP